MRKRKDTNVAFTREFTWDIESKEQYAQPDLELFNRIHQGRRDKRVNYSTGPTGGADPPGEKR
jgi:hypothetical protein